MKGTVAALLAALLLSGCAATPQSREVGSTADCSVLGVTAAGEQMEILAAAPGGQESDVYRGIGPTPAACIEDLTASGEQIVSCAHVEHILVDPSGVDRIPELLSYAFQEPQQSTETQLWLVRGSLPEAFRTQVARRMEIWKTAGKDRQGFRPVTLREAASALAQGEGVLIPALEMGPAGLTFAGFGLYKEGGVVSAWLTGETATGAALLLGQRIHWMGGTGRQALSLQSTGCRVTPVFQGNVLTGLQLRCTLEGVPAGGSAWTGSDRRRVEQEIAGSIAQALAVLQAQGVDGAGLMDRAGLCAPFRWPALVEQWQEAFPTLCAAVTAAVTLSARK